MGFCPPNLLTYFIFPISSFPVRDSQLVPDWLIKLPVADWLLNQAVALSDRQKHVLSAVCRPIIASLLAHTLAGGQCLANGLSPRDMEQAQEGGLLCRLQDNTHSFEGQGCARV